MRAKWTLTDQITRHDVNLLIDIGIVCVLLPDLCRSVGIYLGNRRRN